MIPLRLSMTNFICYRDGVAPLELEGVHLACICGNNGHGKSALLDAITWALWGEARAKTQEELVHQGQTNMSVELEFLAQGQRYKVVRKHSRSSRGGHGNSLLELYVAASKGSSAEASGGDFRPITGNTIRETEAHIKGLLHMDYDTFTSSAFLLQGRADRFTAAPPSERKRILGEILDLGYYDSLEARAKERSRERASHIRGLEDTLKYIAQEVERRPEYQRRLEEASEALEAMEPRVEAERQRAEELQSSVSLLTAKKREMESLEHQSRSSGQEMLHFERQVKEHLAVISEYEATLQRAEAGALTQMEEALREIEKEREALKEGSQKVQFMVAEIRTLKSDNTRIMEQMKELRTKFDLLSDGEAKCPLCAQPLGADGMAHLKAELESQGRDLKGLYQQNDVKAKELESQRQRLNTDVSRRERELDRGLQEAQASLITLKSHTEEAMNNLPSQREKLRQANEMLERRRKEAEEALRQTDELKKQIEGLPQQELDLKKVLEELRGLSDNRQRYTTQKGVLEEQIERCNRLEEEAREKRASMSRVQREKGIYEELATAFGKSGVQALIIESALPQLQDDANELLGQLTDNRMAVKLETQRQRRTRQGDPIETLEIKISDELGTRSYETFSGGESFRVNFALRIALSKLLARRAGAPLPILFIDEGFGTQDAAGRERLLEAIKFIESEFDKIFVITHIDELKDAFPVRIEVTKTEEGSRYVLV